MDVKELLEEIEEEIEGNDEFRSLYLKAWRIFSMLLHLIKEEVEKQEKESGDKK